MTEEVGTRTPTEEVKSCCARLYEQDVIQLLLGDSYHPGGLDLTTKLGKLLNLTAQSRVLDVASGRGTTALHLARTFGCHVVGVDYGADNVRKSNEQARAEGLADRVVFYEGDSEQLPVDDASFDGIVCECAFCTFPDKDTAAREFIRVLRPGGKVGLGDITRVLELPPELQSLMAWVACIADAQPLDGYCDVLKSAGLKVESRSVEDQALKEMVSQIRMRLFGLEVAVGLKKMELPGMDFKSAKEMASAADQAVRQGQLGYALIQATRI